MREEELDEESDTLFSDVTFDLLLPGNTPLTRGAFLGTNRVEVCYLSTGDEWSWRCPGEPFHLTIEGKASGAVCARVALYSLLSSIRESRPALVALRMRSNVESLRCFAFADTPHGGVEHLHLHAFRVSHPPVSFVFCAERRSFSDTRVPVTLLLFPLMGRGVVPFCAFFCPFRKESPP